MLWCLLVLRTYFNKKGSCSRKINRNNLSCNTLLEIKFLTSATHESGWAPQKGQWLWQTQADLLELIIVMLILLGLCKAQLMPTCLQILLLPHLLSWHWRLKLPVLSVSQLVEVRWVGRCCTGAASPAAGEENKLWFSVVAGEALLAWWNEKGGRSTWVQSLEVMVWNHHKLFSLWAVLLATCSESLQLWWLCSVMCLLPLSLSFPLNQFTAPSVTLWLYVLFKHPVFSNENRTLC